MFLNKKPIKVCSLTNLKFKDWKKSLQSNLDFFYHRWSLVTFIGKYEILYNKYYSLIQNSIKHLRWSVLNSKRMKDIYYLRETLHLGCLTGFYKYVSALDLLQFPQKTHIFTIASKIFILWNLVMILKELLNKPLVTQILLKKIRLWVNLNAKYFQPKTGNHTF